MWSLCMLSVKREDRKDETEASSQELNGGEKMEGLCDVCVVNTSDILSSSFYFSFTAVCFYTIWKKVLKPQKC